MSSKFTSRTSWRQKLERQQEARIVNIPPKMQQHLGKGTMVIPRPLEVDALIRKVRQGRLVTVPQLREELAKRSRVDVACPLTTGIFIRIAAEAAEEQRRAGTKAVTPYWRVLSSEGGLNPKFPGGIAAQRRRLSAEGHRVSKPHGKKPPAVVDFEKSLTRFSSN
jgi:6-O-methylguanine DNA methyltransferase, DNA binding domain